MEKEDMKEMEQREPVKTVSQTKAHTKVDKENQAAVKPLTKLVMLGEEGAACHFVDGQIVCD